MMPAPKYSPGNLVVSCLFDHFRHDDLVPEHLLGMQVSGETRFQFDGRVMSFGEGSFMLLRKNQLLRPVKVASATGDYQLILVFLSEAVLRSYATDRKITEQKRGGGAPVQRLRSDPFLRGYMVSLMPYLDRSVGQGHLLSRLKVYEAIELLLRQDSRHRLWLFDFSGPPKTDLRRFMDENYRFNVPIAQFAQLTGRSLAGFKRDFTKAFGTSPRGWLQMKRLAEAYRLMKLEGHKPADIYLELGFENLSHFYSSFKRQYGVTPARLQSRRAKKIKKSK